jgi:hypothetical protein
MEKEKLYFIICIENSFKYQNRRIQYLLSHLILFIFWVIITEFYPRILDDMMQNKINKDSKIGIIPGRGVFARNYIYDSVKCTDEI